MRSPTRIRVLPLAACASLFFIPNVFGVPDAARASDVGEEAPFEEPAYDYGDDDYVPPSPIYYALRGAVSADEFSNRDLGEMRGVAVGVDLDQVYDVALTRLELEIDFIQRPTSPDNRATGILGFASLYRDLGEFYSIRPYIGAGVGGGHVEGSTGIAWHATTGVSLDWSEQSTIEIGYRYTAVEGLDVEPARGLNDDRLDTHAVYAGLRFRL